MGKVFTREDYIKLKEANNGSTDLVIPEGYDEIGESVFMGSDLTSIEIPSTVEKIGIEAFAYCRKLQQVKFADGSVLEQIGEGAFRGTALTTIEIPKNVKKIDDFAFEDCYELQQVIFAEDSKLEKLGRSVFCCSDLTEISFPSSLKKIDYLAFNHSNLNKVIFGKDAIMKYPDDDRIRELTVHLRNCELADLLVQKFATPDLFIKYDNYRQLIKFDWEGCKFYSNITLIGKKLSIIGKYNIKRVINKVKEHYNLVHVIGNNPKATIIFEEARVAEEIQPTIVDSNSKSVFSKENEELLSKIKNICAALPKDLQVPLNNKISSLLEEYKQKQEQEKPNLNDYLNSTNSFQNELPLEGDLEHWLFSKLLEVQNSLIHYDSIIFDLKRLESCRELLKGEIESKPKELTDVEDMIMTIMYLVGKVDNNKKEEVLKDLELFLNETVANYNTELQEMHKLYENNESNILLPGDEYALPMVDLKVKLLAYMEELSKYVIKVTPYLSLLETLKTKEVLEYKGATNSIYDTILDIKYVIPLIKNQVAREAIEKEFSSSCDEFIEKIESIIPKINEVDANEYLNLEKELIQRLQPLLEKLDLYANQNDYMEQLINCRNMLKSNGEVNLDSKKVIESYIGETYGLILKIPLNEQELARQRLFAVIEKWLNNMPEEKNGLNLLREIYSDITEINFSLREYLDAKVDYDSKFKR